jgi:DNA-binding CsgD family transcriptional regulator
MATRPDSTERRHATAVLETVDGARSLGEFLTLTLEALDEHLGIRRSAFMLALSDGRHLDHAGAGRATIAGVCARFGGQQRRDSVRRNGDQKQLSFRLAGCGWSDGYLTLVGGGDGDEHARRMLETLAPSLTERLRRHLPRGIGGVLSARESQVAELLALGFSNREIAQIMCIEEDTVKKHVAHATDKLGLRGRTQLAVCWSSGRLLELPVTPA